MSETDIHGNWKIIQDQINADALDISFNILRNPSITAFPKTRLTNDNSVASNDQDPGAAELLYWRQNQVTYPACNTMTLASTPPNILDEMQFYEPPGSGFWQGGWHSMQTKPSWYQNNDPKNPYHGTNAQRSFGIYNNGPKSTIDQQQVQHLKDNNGGDYIHGMSYGIGNYAATDNTKYQIAFPTPDALKRGTYDTALGVQFYRKEVRVKDSSMVTFAWGNVYVEDTTLPLPIREVILNTGEADTNGYASHTAMRDSIFQTEWFDWPPSAQIRYKRFMSMPLMAYFDTTYDTVTVGSVTMIDSIAHIHIDSTYQSDSSFYGSGVSMKYTVELVHKGGIVDTIEQCRYNPHGGTIILPKEVHIANTQTMYDTVKLRVRGEFANIPDADTNVEFIRETMLDDYPMYLDTTIAIKAGGGITPPPDTCFKVIGPYPNPSWHDAENVSVLAHYCSSGATITAQVYDLLANPVGSSVSITSDGQVWDRIQIPAPSMSGTYYIQVTCGGYSATQNFYMVN